MNEYNAWSQNKEEKAEIPLLRCSDTPIPIKDHRIGVRSFLNKHYEFTIIMT
jgi:hypothetical protein